MSKGRVGLALTCVCFAMPCACRPKGKKEACYLALFYYNSGRALGAALQAAPHQLSATRRTRCIVCALPDIGHAPGAAPQALCGGARRECKIIERKRISRS